MQIYSLLKGTETQTVIIILMTVAALCVVTLVASGALMSIGNFNDQVILTVHRVALAVRVTSMIVIYYFLNGRTV